jgi:1-acyl-sn-glycerol-3-phosphate acyltransferase
MIDAPGYPRSGNAFTRAVGRLVLAATRFRIAGVLPATPKFVVCVAPHTSNWDFVVVYAAELTLGLRASWLGKHSLFRGPLGQLLRAMGGIAVDRRAAHGVVGQVVRRFAESPSLAVGIAPEGTRRRVDRWRSGFYHIAHQAGVPIVPVGLDWGRRTVRIGDPLTPTGDETEDLATLHAFFAAVRGKLPHNAFPPPANSPPIAPAANA